ncbi:MAG: hypothetical protein ABI758_05070 [Candidatus Woesebacteria bacterium]
MVSLKSSLQHLQKLTRFSSFIFFILFLCVYTVTTKVMAAPYDNFCTGANPPALCAGCAGSPNQSACAWCKTGNNFPTDINCRTFVAGYNTSLPLEVKEVVEGRADHEKDGSLNAETHNTNVLRNTGGYLAVVIGGGGTDANNQAFFGPPPAGVQAKYYESGAIGSLTKATGFVAAIPISTGEYVAYVRDSLQNPFGAQPAYAQGLGFSSLRPVLGLWRLFRNVAYFFFVLIFLVIGFLIMFRSRLGGQAAVTIQQALPKIVIALLLVTFSYAIAGLMVDLMYLIIFLMINIFTVSSAAGKLDNGTLTNIAFSNNILGNIWNLISGGAVSTIATQIGTAVTDMLSTTGWSGVSGLAGFGAGIIFLLVMLVALLVNMFRIFFALLKAYVGVIFAVVFAPIQLLIGAVPGQNTFGAWIKGLWENLLVFPVVIFFLFCAQYFTYNPNDNFGTTGQGGFAAPQLGIHAGSSGTFVLAILQFGILAMIPQAVEIAKQLATGKLNLDVGKAAGEFASKGFKGGELIPGVGLTGLAGVGGVGKAYTGWKNSLIGTDAYRKRQQELMVLAPKDKKQYIDQYGGVIGVYDRLRGRKRATNEQVDRSEARRDKAGRAFSAPLKPDTDRVDSDF